MKAFDLQEIKEQQEAAQVAGELFSKITGDVAKAFEFEDGSKEKIAMHALAGALAAKMSGGNVATGAAAGAGSEWLNTYVTGYRTRTCNSRYANNPSYRFRSRD